MDKIEKIKAEIERLMNRYDSEYDKDESEIKAAKGNVCHEILCFIDSLPEEPVSEELEEAALEYANNQLIKSGVTDTNCPRELAVAQASLMVNGFKAGVQWQKEVFEKNRLAACDRATKEEIEREQDFVDKVLIGEQRQPTFSDAIEYGIKWQKQQTIDKACNAFNKIFQGEFAQDIIDRYIKDFCKTLEEGCL